MGFSSEYMQQTFKQTTNMDNIWMHWTVHGQHVKALDSPWTTFGSTGHSVDNVRKHWTGSGQHV